MGEKKKLYEEKEDLEYAVIDETPIQDFCKFFVYIMRSIGKIYTYIKNDIDEYKKRISDRLINKDLIKLIGMTVDDIQDFWEISGSIMLSIRPYTSINFGEKYSKFNNIVPENAVFDIISSLSGNIDDAWEEYELMGNVSFLDEATYDMCKNLMNYKRMCYKYDHIKKLDDKISQIWWNYREFLNNIINNCEEVDEIVVNNEYIEFFIKFISTYKSSFDIYSDDKQLFSALNSGINVLEFATIIINKAIYLYYEKLSNMILEVYEEIKAMKKEEKFYLKDE